MLFLRYYLWIAPHLLCGVALLVAIRKKTHRRLPAFVTLLAFYFVFELLVLFPIPWFFSQSTYMWWLVLGVAAAFLLELLVLVDLAREMLLSSASVSRTFRPMPRWTAAVLILFAVTLSALLPQTAREQVMNVFDTLNFGLNLMAIGLLLAMLLFTRVLGISWRGIPAGIVLGFGVLAATEIAASSLRAQLGKTTYLSFDILRMAAFHVCVLVWFVYLLLPEKPRSFGGTGLQMSDLDLRLKELQRMARR